MGVDHPCRFVLRWSTQVSKCKACSAHYTVGTIMHCCELCNVSVCRACWSLKAPNRMISLQGAVRHVPTVHAVPAQGPSYLPTPACATGPPRLMLHRSADPRDGTRAALLRQANAFQAGGWPTLLRAPRVRRPRCGSRQPLAGDSARGVSWAQPSNEQSPPQRSAVSGWHRPSPSPARTHLHYAILALDPLSGPRHMPMRMPHSL